MNIITLITGLHKMSNGWLQHNLTYTVQQTRKSQHSQECKDPCRHCFCALWPRPFDPKTNGFPGLMVKHFCATFAVVFEISCR